MKDKMLVGFIIGVAGITITKTVSGYIEGKMKIENENKKIGLDLAVHAGMGLAAGALMNILDKDEIVEIED